MNSQFESMMDGLSELLEFTKGDKTKCRVRTSKFSSGSALDVPINEPQVEQKVLVVL